MKKPRKKIGATSMRKPGSPRKMEPTGSPSQQAKYILRLYINGATLKSTLAVNNIKQVCKEHLDGRYNLEIIDIYQHVNLARDEQIVAVPTLIKQLPHPLRRLIGDLSDHDKLLFGLDLKIQER